MSDRRRVKVPESNRRTNGHPQRDGSAPKAADPLPSASASADEGGGVRELLRQYGLRYSRPREAILAYMGEQPRHVSAESLFHALRERGEDLSLSTAYLNLGVLADAGLLREFKGAQGESLYDSTTEPHHHLICLETGEVVDVPSPMIEGLPLNAFLKDYVERVTGWRVEQTHLSLHGRPQGDT